jgi:CheY-like chemotaxis protein
MVEAEREIRMLVIDDEEVIHASLRKLLGRQGYRVDAVLDAREGLERLATGAYDLVITDLMMPGMNGIELLQALRRRGSSVPVVMITGYPTIRTALQAMRLGAVDYIAKPFTRKELLSPVRRAMRLEEGAQAGEPPPAASPASLQHGAELFLPHHAWARYQQDGTFEIGIEATFLRAVGALAALAAPDELELVEQGYIALRAVGADGDEHGVAMPLSGQVVAVNREALARPAELTAASWVLRLLPSHLDEELAQLVPRPR